MERLEPSGTLIFTKGIRRLYDLPVFTAAGTLSITSNTYCADFFAVINHTRNKLKPSECSKCY
ncbi:hypothetical protein YEP4_01280 [Yersinia enterocolitica subsp. palearctica YE-P4]|nr:hypothetical protein YE149_01297 [Yersinia enterocolitica subsp. palearctica YE-149]EOR80666.1 hypothetical protein YEP1_01292 [Yersinia enterocolitica subsp. palearctica YE-P1]EOR81259.1 hypothetical protein YE150_01285 [Yersinia enterocolitica subsp. palearctica YE-150]EOR83790.1 hypothetical protein YEP4_01280 [Yersinia enterocolitica subsp. palearctica YE-P4]